jgi:hypothetical protein
MKLVTNKETTLQLLAEILSEYQILEANPFAAAAEKEDAGGGEEPAADAEAGGEEKGKDDKKAKPAEPEGITIEFDKSAVKRYNKAPFALNKGVVKSITKDGIQVAVDGGATILVNFSDITSK